MKLNLTSNRLNIILLMLLVLLGIGSIAYNKYLIDRILEKERSSVELWAKATEYLANSTEEKANRILLDVTDTLDANPAVADSLILLLRSVESGWSAQNFVAEQIILRDRFQIPTLIVNERDQILGSKYISEDPDSTLVEEFAALNPPIVINLGTGENSRRQYVYYGESATVRYLRYFPYIQLSVLALLLGVAFLSYRSISQSEQSNIWVGMTREAAHQMGTPLSSLYGWVELLREEKKEDAFIQKVCSGLDDDIARLKMIAARFNKIGSEPKLEVKPIAPVINEVINYAKDRLPQLSKDVELKAEVDKNMRAKVNADLFRWAMENVIKNSMDAIKSNTKNAFVLVKVYRKEDRLMIDIEDSGKGIEKKFHEEIFKPGYSTKKRGWGLGLSLARRIIEQYHGGKIYVVRSDIGAGTTLRIILKDAT